MLPQLPVHALQQLPLESLTAQTPTPPNRRQRLLVFLGNAPQLHPPLKFLAPMGGVFSDPESMG